MLLHKYTVKEIHEGTFIKMMRCLPEQGTKLMEQVNSHKVNALILGKSIWQWVQLFLSMMVRR